MSHNTFRACFTHPQAKLRIFHPHRSCTALGYMVDSRDVFVTPQKNRPPEKREAALTTNAQWILEMTFFQSGIRCLPVSFKAKEHWYPQYIWVAPRPGKSNSLTNRGTISSFCSAWPRRPYPPNPHENTRFWESNTSCRFQCGNNNISESQFIHVWPAPQFHTTHRVISTTCYIPSHNIGHRKHLAILGLFNKNGHPSRDQLTVEFNALGTSNELSIRVMPF